MKTKDYYKINASSDSKTIKDVKKELLDSCFGRRISNLVYQRDEIICCDLINCSRINTVHVFKCIMKNEDGLKERYLLKVISSKEEIELKKSQPLTNGEMLNVISDASLYYNTFVFETKSYFVLIHKIEESYYELSDFLAKIEDVKTYFKILIAIFEKIKILYEHVYNGIVNEIICIFIDNNHDIKFSIIENYYLEFKFCKTIETHTSNLKIFSIEKFKQNFLHILEYYVIILKKQSKLTCPEFFLKLTEIKTIIQNCHSIEECMSLIDKISQSL